MKTLLAILFSFSFLVPLNAQVFPEDIEIDFNIFESGIEQAYTPVYDSNGVLIDTIPGGIDIDSDGDGVFEMNPKALYNNPFFNVKIPDEVFSFLKNSGSVRISDLRIPYKTEWIDAEGEIFLRGGGATFFSNSNNNLMFIHDIINMDTMEQNILPRYGLNNKVTVRVTLANEFTFVYYDSNGRQEIVKTDSNLSNNVKTIEFEILDPNGENPDNEPRFEISFLNPSSPQTFPANVKLDASELSDKFSPLTITNYKWFFGDKEFNDPKASQEGSDLAIVEHKYKSPGTDDKIDVSLEVTLSDGTTKTIYPREELKFDNTNFQMSLTQWFQNEDRWNVKENSGGLKSGYFYANSEYLTSEKMKLESQNIPINSHSFRERSMARVGCATTAIAMVTQYYAKNNDVPVSLNPIEMNNVLKMNGGYTDYSFEERSYSKDPITHEPWSPSRVLITAVGGDLKYSKVPKIVKTIGENLNKDFEIDYSRIEKGFETSQLRDKAIEFIRKGTPVIIKTESLTRPENPNIHHYVVGVGIEGERIKVYDPARQDRIYLKQDSTDEDERRYPGTVRGLRALIDKKDPAAIRISTRGGIFLLTAPDGRRIGVEPETGDFINDFDPENAGIGTDYISDAEEIESDEVIKAGLHYTLFLKTPIEDTFKLEVFNLEEDSQIDLEISTYDENGFVNKVQTDQIQVSKGEVVEKEFLKLNDPAQMGTLTIKDLKIRNRRKQDFFHLKGHYTLSDESNGLEIGQEVITLNINHGFLNKTFEIGSFKRRGHKYVYFERKRKSYLKIVLDNRGHVDIWSKGPDFISLLNNKNVHIFLQVGDDIIETPALEQAPLVESPLKIIKAVLYPKRVRWWRHFWKRKTQHDTLKFSGGFNLNRNSNGIHPETEKTTVSIGGISILPTLDAKIWQKRFKQYRGGYILKEKIGKSQIEIFINRNNKINVTAKGLDLENIDFSKKVEVVIQIGDDIFKDEALFYPSRRKPIVRKKIRSRGRR